MMAVERQVAVGFDRLHLLLRAGRRQFDLTDQTLCLFFVLGSCSENLIKILEILEKTTELTVYGFTVFMFDSVTCQCHEKVQFRANLKVFLVQYGQQRGQFNILKAWFRQYLLSLRTNDL